MTGKEHEQVVAAGGLHIIGTERHESRRIDNQLRGRAGRPGDPGSSRFYLSLEDDLMRLFANAGIVSSMLEKSFKEGEPLEHPFLNHSIGTAQKRVEGQNYSMRKRLLQYERINISKTGFGADRNQGPSLADIAKKYVGTKDGILADTDLRARGSQYLGLQFRRLERGQHRLHRDL